MNIRRPLKIMGYASLGIVFFIAMAIFLFLYFLGKALYVDHDLIKATTEQAIRENNPSLCDKLPEAVPDIQPRWDCYVNVAVARKNTKACGVNSFCYGQIASNYKDVKVCDELGDLLKPQIKTEEQRKELCQGSAECESRVLMYENYLGAIYDCYTSYVMTTHDEKVCQRFSGSSTQEKHLMAQCYSLEKYR